MNKFIFGQLWLTLIILAFFSTFMNAQQAQVTINQDSRITELLNLKIALEKEGDISGRYKIQLYSGNLNAASATMKTYRNKLGTWTSDIKHETPNYKVWIGNFRNRLEADRALIDVKKEFPSAFIFKPDR